jgi:hypothetical protein
MNFTYFCRIAGDAAEGNRQLLHDRRRNEKAALYRGLFMSGSEGR